MERPLHVLAQPAADLGFVLLVHGEKADERTRLAGKVLRRADRNAGAGQEQALALLLVVDREVDEIRGELAEAARRLVGLRGFFDGVAGPRSLDEMKRAPVVRAGLVR